MGAPASLLLAGAIMTIVNFFVFLELGAHRSRLPRFIRYQAVVFQFVAAICATVAAANIASFTMEATRDYNNPNRGP
jgi:hypothetical protein